MTHDLALPHTPTKRRLRRALIAGAATAAVLVMLTIFDHRIWSVLRVADRAKLESRDWYQVLRQGGNVLPWLIVAACVLLHDRAAKSAHNQTPRRAAWWHRGLELAASPVAAGLLAEGLKLLFRRSRPLGDGQYHFAWISPHEKLHFGMPSSHAAVALGGACAVSAIFPAARFPVFVLAVGTCVSRTLAGAHFASDIFAGALVGWAAAKVVRTVVRRVHE